MATNEPMTDEQFQTVSNWLAGGHKAPTPTQVVAIMAALDEVERQRAVIAEQQAQLDAARGIVAVVAQSNTTFGNACVFDDRCGFLDTGYDGNPFEPPVLSIYRHVAECPVAQARAFMARYPAEKEA